MLAAVGLRANSSLAGFFGSSGLASGGNGFGLTVPLSCARARLGGESEGGGQQRGRKIALQVRAKP